MDPGRPTAGPWSTARAFGACSGWGSHVRSLGPNPREGASPGQRHRRPGPARGARSACPDRVLAHLIGQLEVMGRPSAPHPGKVPPPGSASMSVAAARARRSPRAGSGRTLGAASPLEATSGQTQPRRCGRRRGSTAHPGGGRPDPRQRAAVVDDLSGPRRATGCRGSRTRSSGASRPAGRRASPARPGGPRPRRRGSGGFAATSRAGRATSR